MGMMHITGHSRQMIDDAIFKACKVKRLAYAWCGAGAAAGYLAGWAVGEWQQNPLRMKLESHHLSTHS